MTLQYVKKERYSRTGILDRFESGWATIIYSNGIAKRIYKLDTNKGLYILKVITCTTEDRDQLKQAIEEYNLTLRASKLTKGVAKPVDFKHTVDKAGDTATAESLYEYGGENLHVALSKATGKEAINVMREVINIMVILHDNKIFHSDLKPTNIVYKDGIVKIIDFGVSQALSSKASLFTTATKDSEIIGCTAAYCPPEILRNKKYVLGMVDVYNWGMTLYQLITGKSNSELRREMDLKMTDEDYLTFLDNVERMIVKGDYNGQIKNNIVGILIKVFDIKPKRRPTFAALKEFFKMNEYYYKEGDSKISPKNTNKIKKQTEMSSEEDKKAMSPIGKVSSEKNEEIKFSDFVAVKFLFDNRMMTYLLK